MSAVDVATPGFRLSSLWTDKRSRGVLIQIIALIALYRPGPMQFIPQFIEGKKDPSTVQIPHPLLKELVEET